MKDFSAQYPEFIFESFDIEMDPSGIHVTYLYKLGEHEFKPTVNIPAAEITNNEIDKNYLRELFFNFGIINAISYYKLTCAPVFNIKAGYIDDNQKLFFRKLFYCGLGEFMYINQLNIHFDDFMKITCAEPSEQRKNAKNPTDIYELGTNYNGAIITVGGGKDSIVSLMALQPLHDENLTLQFNRDLYPTDHASIACIREAGYSSSKMRNFNLSFDKKLLELNKQGFYNGHIPFSSTLAFATVIVAYLNKKQYIVLSNEASANEGNVPGTQINHQYSKSFEFEKDFQNYCEYYLNDKIFYFSLLRCMNEFQIVQKFIKFPNYLPIFRSCNIGMKENKWCGHCAKCLYVYIMLYPFVDHDKLKAIFHSDMLDNPDFFQLYAGLVNPDVNKPFECVGTKAEICYSLNCAVDWHIANKVEMPYLLQQYYSTLYGQVDYSYIPNYYNPENAIPQKYLDLLLAL